MQFILALDQGTSSSRAIVFDNRGRIHSSAQLEFTQHFPADGWVEHDAIEIWRTQLEVAQRALLQGGIAASSVAGIGITNQRETTVLWDRATGEPVAKAIVWQDRRTAPSCDALRARGVGGLIQQKTGLPLDPYFSATKLQWLLDNVPGARARAEKGQLAFGTIDSWLVFKLTSGKRHVTDASNASRTMLFNIHSCDWDDELLALFNVPRSVLPEIVPSSGVLGATSEGLLGAAIPIAGLAGDQQSAAFGQGCHKPGLAKNTYGTGCFALLNTGAHAVPSRHQMLTTVGWQLGSETTYMLEGSVFMGGAIVQWLRDQVGIISRASDIEALAAQVPDSGGVMLVPGFAGLGAPYWDPYVRGTMLGMTRNTSRAHIARAVLDAIAYQSVELFDALQADAGIALSELRVDGGACRNDILMQFQSDLLGVAVVRPKVIETTALGAAYLAGLGVGMWASLDEVASHWEVDRRFEPSLSQTRRSELMGQWRKAVKVAREWRAEQPTAN
jgi:glycerol kinase